MKSNLSLEDAYEKCCKKILDNNDDINKILRIIKSVNKNLALSAGTIRNTIWQVLEGQKQVIMSDIDIVYYDNKSSKEEENKIEKELYKINSNYKWQVKNEYYMNQYNFINEPKFPSLYDAISHFVETPTCVGAYLDKYDNIQLIAPYGIKDLMNLNCRPIPLFIKDKNKLYVYKERMLKKKWKNMFPNLTIYLD